MGEDRLTQKGASSIPLRFRRFGLINPARDCSGGTAQPVANLGVQVKFP